VVGLMVCLVAIYQLSCLFFSSSRAQDDETKTDRRSMLVKRRVDTELLLRYVRYYQSDPFHLTPRLASFGSLLASLMLSACVLTVLCLFLSLSVYLLKQSDVGSEREGGEKRYVTHTHMYNWLWTMAFVSGTTPALILFLTGFLCLSYFNVVMNRLGGSEEPSPPVPASPSRSLSLRLSVMDEQSHFLRIASVWTIFLVNITVVGTINGLYIWSTLLDLASEARLWIQLSFALFSSLWSPVLRIGLPSRIKESRYGVWLFICLNAMNTVMIPCAVTALSTPSCYQVSVSLSADSHSYRC
jgi:hypothetical protein